MFSAKSNWKKFLLLISSLLLVVSMVLGIGGCASEEEAEGTTSEPTVEDEAEKPTIVFSDQQWESMWLENAIAQFIIEEGYGYPTETIQMSTATMKLSILKGEVDVCLEAWQQNFIDWYEENIEAGNVEELGFALEGGPQFWCIPQWVHEEYNINTVQDMKDHAELFTDPEDPNKGLFINSITGWACTAINDVKFEAYGLDDYFNIIEPGSAGAETAALAGAQKKHEPVFGYYWSPTPLMGMYDWYVLEEPAYDADVWDDILAAVEDETLRPVDEACAYESVPLAIMANKDLRTKAPDVVDMLSNMVIGLDRCNKALAWAEENEIQDWEKAAVWFLREYDSVWNTWVTSDAYTKIKASLDAYGDL